MAVGRPRTFDLDTALEQALRVFWQRGYEGATLPELTAAMGINRPSLYAAFGGKEALFRQAIDRYVERHALHLQSALQQPTARAVAEAMFDLGIDLITGRKNPRGCFLVQGALVCGDTAERIRQELARRRSASENALRKRFERAIAEGDLPARANAADLARFVTTVMQGLSVQAAGGASRNQLKAVARLALAAWPQGR